VSNTPTKDTQSSDTPTKQQKKSSKGKKETLPPPIGTSESPGIEELADELAPDKLTTLQLRVAKRLTGLYGTIGVFTAGADAYDGVLLIKCAEARAEEIVRAARHNKAVWNVLVKVVEGGDLGSMLIGHTLMFYAILAHHGRAKKNELLLSQLGYSEEIILQQPEGINGYQPDLQPTTSL
jgi:hypothetical protein